MDGQSAHTDGAGNVPIVEASPYSILVLDDEVAIADLVKEIFQAEGMKAHAYYDPKRALEAVRSEKFDLAIVDIMMPVMDGYEFCRALRQISDVPVVFLSAKDEETDIVVGFALGADDYVVKPFKPRELVARVKARLRHTAAQSEKPDPAVDGGDVLEAQGIVVDTKAHEAFLHDVALSLTPKEFAILCELLIRKGEPVPSAMLYEHCWQEAPDASSANTIMVHIRHLRTKLAKVDSSKEFIETAWGVGYRIQA